VTTQGKTINITLKVWRQKGPDVKGKLETIEARDISTDMSFLEMLDTVNESLIIQGKEPIEFDNDCREGICGMCGAVVNGIPHGPEKAMTLCQLHMRKFKSGDVIVVEPWRARAFPIIKDLVVDRGALDKIIQSGGFVSAVVLALLPQGKPEAAQRAWNMVHAMDDCGFGNCTNEKECEAACPKEISIVNIARMNREFIKAGFASNVL